MTAENVILAALGDRVAAERRADPQYADEADYHEAMLAEIAAGRLPERHLHTTVSGRNVASVVATWGPGDPRSAALTAIMAQLPLASGWVETKRGWRKVASLTEEAGAFLRGDPADPPSACYPTYLVETVPGEAAYVRRLLVPPPVRDSADAGSREDGR